MAILDELVTQIENPDLRTRIAAEVEKLAKQKKFGLVFEEHLPECTPLWDIPVKKGSKVALKAGQVSDFYTVLKIEDGVATCLNKDKSATAEFTEDELVCVAEFGEPIYPYLKPLDTVCNAPDSDLWHTLIEADNYHALQLLEYLYAGKVDCIYIDPPYNTGARDWKYNNDYVDNSDQYRHSKWLSFMKKRLTLAKKLLNPVDSVLIVAINEKEYLHLGCLLEEVFAGCDIQMIVDVINPRFGIPRAGTFTRTEEYLFIIRLGRNVICESESLIGNEPEKENTSPIWFSLLRTSSHSTRRERPNLFYPVYVYSDGRLQSVGEPLPLDQDKNDLVSSEPGVITLFPLRPDGRENTWNLGAETLRTAFQEGTAKVSITKSKITLNYLRNSEKERIKSGEIEILGKDENGALILRHRPGATKKMAPRSVWISGLHDATIYGSTMLNSMIGKRFSFPKSLYSVYDSINFFVANKPNALIIDFFAGSGTTLHAVNLLNSKDNGRRRCIMVTNNEVSVDEAKALVSQGHQPGSEAWNKLGIARYVNWPRTVCSIEGHDVNGNPLKGNYVGSDIPMADGFKTNAAFFKLGFLDKNAVALGRQFKEMLPTLWMKAGAIGSCPSIEGDVSGMLILPKNKFAVLVDEKQYMDFVEKLDEHPEIEIVFIVTDSESGYRDMVVGLDVKESFQLYQDYLDNFRINSVRR